MGAQIVTVGSDGFRDFVVLPDGRTHTLGTVSVLKLITSLVSSGGLMRQALDTFLRNKEASFAVDIDALMKLLAPKRARWAGHENRLIQPISRTLLGASMNKQAQAVADHVASVEKDLASLQQAAPEARQAATTALNATAAKLVEALTTPDEGDLLVDKLASLEVTVADIKTAGTASPDAVKALQDLSGGLVAASTVTSAVDKQMMEELQVYMDNESSLYNGKKAILANIMRKMKAGKYDHKLAPKLWMYWVDEGAKKYAKEFNTDVRTMFPAELRRELAQEIADEEKRLIDAGEYGNMKVAAEEKAEDEPKAEEKAEPKVEEEPKKEQKAAASVTAYEDVIVNEALAQSVMTRVEAALKVVQASTKPNTIVATNDLHTISSRLASTLAASDLGDAGLKPVLLGFVANANKIHDHFSVDATSKKEWEQALKKDESYREKLKADIKTLEAGGQVENLSLANAKKQLPLLEEAIANKKKLIGLSKD